MTRDPSRIPIVLDAIRKAWEQQPDLRLCQLVVNVAGRDPFYVEDDRFVALLEAYTQPCRHARTMVVTTYPAWTKCMDCGARL